MSILCNQLLNPKEQVDALVKLCIVLVPFLSFISYPPLPPILHLTFFWLYPFYILYVLFLPVFLFKITRICLSISVELLFEIGNSYLGLLVVKDSIILLEKDVTED